MDNMEPKVDTSEKAMRARERKMFRLFWRYLRIHRFRWRFYIEYHIPLKGLTKEQEELLRESILVNQELIG